MKNTLFISLFIAALGAFPLLANDDVPHEKKGFQESGYSLSQYENVNLANGNLTYQTPLYTLRTDGGLEYPLTAYYNVKTWYTHQYCSLNYAGYDSCGTEGGEILSAEIADGVETYGFGWDLRPPRVLDVRLGTQHGRSPAIVDASGARHLLRSSPPWDSTPVNDIRYTTDGSNYRLTTVTKDTSGRPTKIRMEDGHGSVYIFDQVVPLDCDAALDDLDPSDNPLTDFNFGTQTTGLYLSEIQRGPWLSGPDGGIPENKISFNYLIENSDFDSTCNEQWRLSNITAHGEVDRMVSFSYTILDGVTVLNYITIPTFDPRLGSNASSPDSTTINWSLSTVQFQQYNGTMADIMYFNAPHLDEITLPENVSFIFSQGTRGFMESVELPSGALIEYTEGSYPLGIAGWSPNAVTREEERDVGPYERHCGINVPVRPLEPPPAPVPGSRSMSSRGVAMRRVTYADASDPSGSRYETTFFSQGLSCVGIDHFDQNGNNSQWPYYFDPFLRDDNFLKTEYLFTVVSTQGGAATSVTTSLKVAEIHRFHPLTREEFSVDYVEGPEASYLHLNAVAWPYGEDIGDVSNPVDVRVLRHTEIEKAVLPGNYDDKDLEVYEDRYTFETKKRTFSDIDGDPALQDVKSCYPMVTPGNFIDGTPEPDIECFEVRQTTDPTTGVDDYYNILLTTIESFNAPAGLAVTRTVESFYAYGDPPIAEDPYIWVLGVKFGEDVTENDVTSSKGFSWKNLSFDASDVQRYYVLGEQAVNPAPAVNREISNTLNTTITTTCNGDCVLHEYGYDSLGNLTSDALSGGAGYGYNSLNTTTNISFSHGRAVRKKLESTTDSMLLWEREVDPSTGLTRWHVNGSGMGFAYLYDNAGRFTDIAPVDGDDISARAVWDIDLQTTLIDDTVTPMKGSHIEYALPTTGVLLKHKVYDATWTSLTIGSELLPGSYSSATLRSTYHFDGLGKLSQETEAYPEGTRSRFHLSYLHGGSELCDEVNPDWDLANKNRVNIDSEWVNGTTFPGCPQGSSWTAWTETQLDGLGRPGVIHGPDRSDLIIDYGGDSIKVMTRSVANSLDGSGNAVLQDFTTTTVSDGFGRLRRLEEEVFKSPATTYVTTYLYNERDQLTDVSLYNPGETAAQNRSFTYWGTGFLKASCEPERRLFLQGYDAAGNLKEEFTEFTTTTPLICEYDPLSTGATVTHGYDDFGRLENSKEGLTTIIEQTWGNPHGGSGAMVGQPSYNRVVESSRHNFFETDVEVTHKWVYNGPGGRPSGRKTLISGVGSTDDGFQINYGYDTWGNQNEVYFPFFNGCRYSSWELIERTYDGEWVTDAHIETPAGVEKAIGQMTYHLSGRVSALDYGNGFASWLEFEDDDKMARPERIQLWIDGNPVPGGFTGTFEYDGSGNVWQIGSKRYSYDGLSRLEDYSLWENTARTLDFQEGYDFDRWGNLTAVDRSAAKTNAVRTNYLTFSLEDSSPADGVPDSNRISSVNNASKASVNLMWDDRGNLWQQGAIEDLRQKEYLWTFDDRLNQSTDVASGVVWRFAYDSAGERVMKWYDNPAGLEAKIFIRDEGGQTVSEWDYMSGGGSFDVTRDYLNAGVRTIAQIDHSGGSESVEYFSTDHLGSTRVVFNDEGTLLDTMEYLPFGAFESSGLSATPPTHMFTGQERDLGTTSSELDYFHARHLSPRLMRFISVDPVRGNTNSSQSRNRYSYVLNNPIKLVDLNGENPFALYAVRIGVGAISGGTSRASYETGKALLSSGQKPTLTNMWDTTKKVAPGAFARGAIVGAVNGASPPGVSIATTAAANATIEYIDQKNAGLSSGEAAERAAVKGAGTAAGNLLTQADITTAAGSALTVVAGEIVSDVVYGLGVEYPEELSSPDGSGDNLGDRKRQMDELKEEELQATPGGGAGE